MIQNAGLTSAQITGQLKMDLEHNLRDAMEQLVSKEALKGAVFDLEFNDTVSGTSEDSGKAAGVEIESNESGRGSDIDSGAGGNSILVVLTIGFDLPNPPEIPVIPGESITRAVTGVLGSKTTVG